MIRFPRRFTEDELARSASAGDKFSALTWQQLFDPQQGDARLAAQVHRESPCDYERLRRAWQYAERQPTPEQQLRLVRNSPLD